MGSDGSYSSVKFCHQWYLLKFLYVIWISELIELHKHNQMKLCFGDLSLTHEVMHP